MLSLLTAIFLVLPPALAQESELTAEERWLLRYTPIVRVVEKTAPAVVYLQTDGSGPETFWGRQQRIQGSGSGVVILKEGFIVTNYHVVENADQIKVSFDAKYDDKTYEGRLVSYVAEEDLALVKIEGVGDFPTVPLGTSSTLMSGEPVVAIGNPYGQTHTVSTGIISGLHRNVRIPGRGLDFDDLIQTDASINRGNSGGPLLNMLGELIGINSVINAQAENMGFAIPVDRVRAVLEDQLLSPKAEHTWLGFTTAESNPLRVSSVMAEGPAAAAGLHVGDLITSINGQPVADEESFRLARIALTPQRNIKLAARRGSDLVDLSLFTWNRQDGMLFERLGLLVQPVVIGRRPFVRVSGIRENGPAQDLGLEPADLIDAVRVKGHRAFRVRSAKVLAALISQLPVGEEIEIDLYRDLNGNGHFERKEMHRGSLELE